MPRTQAGYRYPYATTAAREHDHDVCRVVVERIIRAVAAGAEPWGSMHRLPVIADEATARRLRNRVFGGKFCKELEGRYGTQHSISVYFETADGQLTNRRIAQPDGYHLVVILWGPLAVGRAKVANDIRDGKPVPFNSLAPKEA